MLQNGIDHGHGSSGIVLLVSYLSGTMTEKIHQCRVSKWLQYLINKIVFTKMRNYMTNKLLFLINMTPVRLCLGYHGHDRCAYRSFCWFCYVAAQILSSFPVFRGYLTSSSDQNTVQNKL